MKASKAVSFYRLILSIVLIAMVVAVVGIAVDGWQQGPTEDVGTHVPNGTPNTPTDPPEVQAPPKPTPPTFVSALTGCEVTEAQAGRQPLAIVMNTDGGYGLSSSALTVEFALENGKTRFLAFFEDTDTLGQIGTVAPARGYISDMLRTFGGLLVCYGSDDRIRYDSYDPSALTLDIASKGGCSYTEGTAVYTNGYMLQNGLHNNLLPTDRTQTPTLPFGFTDYGTTVGKASTEAKEIYLPYSALCTTQLMYRESLGRYVLYKDGKTYTDPLSKAAVSYTNAFILFADATTYEKTDVTQLVMDTKAGGAGYYATEGGVSRITWRTDADGRICMYDTAGRALTVNRGSSYISFFKSSMASEVYFG